MARQKARHIDISNMPELLRLAKEIKAANEDIVLELDGEELATLSPIRRRSIGPRPRRATKPSAQQQVAGRM